MNLKELNRRKSEINDLVKTGFNMLDKIKERINRRFNGQPNLNGNSDPHDRKNWYI